MEQNKAAFPWLMDVREPTIAELAERLSAAEADARLARETAAKAFEAADVAEQAAADAQQAAAEAGERLRMVGQIDARIAKDVRTMRVATAVELGCAIAIVVILMLAWCLR